MKKKKARKGFSLIELLVAIVVLAILGAITITAGTAAQRRARVTSAMTVFSDYRTAFNTAMMDHPGLVKDRWNTWVGADGTETGQNYDSKKAFSRLIGYMNLSLSNDLKLKWNDTGYWESNGTDPWGGHYVILEYPTVPADADGLGAEDLYDPTTYPNQPTMCLSIWCTGPDSDIVIPDNGLVEVRDFSVGIGIKNSSGNISYLTHGASDEKLAYTGATIHIPTPIP